MRMNRWEWLARWFRLTPTARRRFRAGIRPSRRQPGESPLRTWVILGRRFHANTKSEARALAKREFGYRDRLPVGTVVVEEKK